MEKILQATHSVRRIITGPRESGKSMFLTSLFPTILNEFEKYITTHQVYTKIFIKKHLNVLATVYQLT